MLNMSNILINYPTERIKGELTIIGIIPTLTDLIVFPSRLKYRNSMHLELCTPLLVYAGEHTAPKT